VLEYHPEPPLQGKNLIFDFMNIAAAIFMNDSGQHGSCGKARMYMKIKSS